eukprot:scaffold75523_cov38-Attheya_sp.AAC.1
MNKQGDGGFENPKRRSRTYRYQYNFYTGGRCLEDATAGRRARPPCYNLYMITQPTPVRASVRTKGRAMMQERVLRE